MIKKNNIDVSSSRIACLTPATENVFRRNFELTVKNKMAKHKISKDRAFTLTESIECKQES